MSATVQGLIKEEYLGDGVYVGFDGFLIVLYTSDGIHHDKPIYLDEDVYAALVRYHETLTSGA